MHLSFKISFATLAAAEVSNCKLGTVRQKFTFVTKYLVGKNSYFDSYFQCYNRYNTLSKLYSREIVQTCPQSLPRKASYLNGLAQWRVLRKKEGRKEEGVRN